MVIIKIQDNVRADHLVEKRIYTAIKRKLFSV